MLTPMSRLVLFNKPYGVLSQFTDAAGRLTLKQYFPDEHIYPAGRLDFDSEGLLLLTDDGQLQHRISDPRFKQPKTYWVQVDGEINDKAISQLQAGITLKDGLTRPAKARRMVEPENLWPRKPPVRYRAAIPTSWLELTISEGRNRQVRRMTAAVGFPTLRLIRARIGDWELGNLLPGEWQEVTVDSPQRATNEQQPARHSASARPSTRRRR
jgi:23S rRNA pseudouridine2457 synthase